jgi:hypothetical protein
MAKYWMPVEGTPEFRFAWKYGLKSQCGRHDRRHESTTRAMAREGRSKAGKLQRSPRS